MINIGEFQVTSGKLLATDPCYDKGTWCTVSIDNVLNGTWVAFVNQVDDYLDSPYKRNSVIQVYHKSFVGIVEPLHRQEGIVGVDSAQAGFFDEDVFPDDTGDYKEGTEYYRICQASNANTYAGTVEYGANSMSGYGDGAYPCFVGYNKDGKVVSASIIFIGDVQEEEEYDNE